MSGDAVCVAGIDLASKQTLRLNEPQPTRRILAALGGLAPGDIVDVNAQHLARPEAPHVEDGHWMPRSLKKIGTMSAEKVQALAQPTTFASLEAAFGTPAPRTGGRNRGWPLHGGERSLASLSVAYIRFMVDVRGKVRAAFKDASGDYWEGVPFQDLSVRTHETSCMDCKSSALDHIKRDFEANAAVIRVGLTRGFAASSDQPGLCWLQVTNVLARDRGHF